MDRPVEAMNQPAGWRNDPGRRIRAYLRCLGIVDEQAVQSLCARILRDAANGKTDDPEQAGLEELLRRKEAWFEVLNRGLDDGESAEIDPLVGWRLARLLRVHPDALLAEPGRESENFAAESGATPAFPDIQERDMPRQPLGELPVGLRKEFWQSVGSGLNHAWHKLLGRSEGE